MSAPILLHDLTLGYDGHPAVHHVSGVIEAGALLAVVGPNGAGKSTLIKGLAGLLKPLVGVELAAPSGNKAEGMLLTAFGLRLDAGIQLGIDGQQLGQALPFLTCVQTGCLVPLDFDEVALSAMKVGTTLEVTGVKVDDGQPVTVPLSLAGFTAAYNRTAELAQ